MVILIDNREQKKLTFGKIDGLECRMTTLLVGDYACETNSGHRFPVCFERKGLGDLYATMTSGYSRFRQELLLAQEHGICLLLGIEATFTEVSYGYPYSSFSGESMIKKLFSLWVKYGLRPVFCQSRAELAQHIVACFAALERNYSLAT